MKDTIEQRKFFMFIIKSRRVLANMQLFLLRKTFESLQLFWRAKASGKCCHFYVSKESNDADKFANQISKHFTFSKFSFFFLFFFHIF